MQRDAKLLERIQKKVRQHEHRNRVQSRHVGKAGLKTLAIEIGWWFCNYTCWSAASATKGNLGVLPRRHETMPKRKQATRNRNTEL